MLLAAQWLWGSGFRNAATRSSGSGKEKGTLPGSLSGRLAWGWTTRLFPPGQLKLHIFGSVSEREQDVLGGQELELGQGIHDVP